jgi:hypothetical protein
MSLRCRLNRINDKRVGRPPPGFSGRRSGLVSASHLRYPTRIETNG